MKAKILNKCPVCGGKLVFNSLNQYTNVYGIKRNGELTVKRIRKEDNGPMEASFIACESGDFVTDCDLRVVDPSDVRINIFEKGGRYYYEKET